MRVLVTESARRVFWFSAVGALVALTLLFAGTGYRRTPLEVTDAAATPVAQASSKEDRDLQREIAALEKRLARGRQRGPYIVIDRSNNRLYLRDVDGVRLTAVCSAGSGQLLRDPSGDREWVFETPIGRHKVLSRQRNPVWRKPDWAFIEENLPIPKDHGERIEYGTLGEYALHFGDGYMIHGTLYERLLGRNVSHGCIRLGRDDLRKVYAASREGTPIFIF